MKKNKTIVIGLTGSIGMGKSTVAKMFGALGVPSISADKIVHDLLSNGGAAEKKVVRLFPSVIDKKGINRKKLFSLAFSCTENREKLEKILHPLVFKNILSFVREKKKEKARAVLLEIPLLFETGFDKKCDLNICVSASQKTQQERVLKRKGMTLEKIKAIRKQQMPDKKKRELSNIVIKTDCAETLTRKQVESICFNINNEGSIHA